MPEKKEPKKEPKKRGRKPKPVDPNAEKKVPKKRGRKPKEKYTPGKAEPEIKHEENYILQIPKKKEMKNDDIVDSNSPEPFNSADDQQLILTDDTPNPEIYRKTCMWCCHEYLTENWGQPFCKHDKLYKTYGQFCSPECSAAYCFDDVSTTDDKKWEIYSMINSIARHIYNDSEIMIKLAPHRNSLKIFGGKYTIEDFREINTDKSRIVKVYLPPTISIIMNIEEITEDSTHCNIKNNISTNDDRYKLIQDNLRLKRAAPLRNEKNTLEHCMQIKIS